MHHIIKIPNMTRKRFSARKQLALALTAAAFIIPTTGARNVEAYDLTGLTDIVKIGAEKVNLRKGPSTSTPRLVAELLDDEVCYMPVAIWSDEAKGKRTMPITGGTYDICLQLDRNHNYGKYEEIPENAELWVKLAYNYDSAYIPVWVKQNFCDIMPVGNLTPDHYYIDSYQKNMLNFRQGGRYDGLCLFMAEIISSEGDPEGLFIGKLVDGKVILPLRYDGYLTVNDNLRNIEVGNGYIAYPSSFELSAERANDMGGTHVLDFSKLTDADIDKILQQSTPMTDMYEIILLMNTIDGGYFQLNIPTDYNDILGLPLEKITMELGKAAVVSPRIVNKPQVESINANATLERVHVKPEGTTLEMSFINKAGIRQWNVNRYAYITCDATGNKQYQLIRTRGVNISPKPTEVSGNRNEKISFSLTFEPIPLNATTLTLVEGPSKDNFHIVKADISE